VESMASVQGQRSLDSEHSISSTIRVRGSDDEVGQAAPTSWAE
jgi:hypothetical protein